MNRLGAGADFAGPSRLSGARPRRGRALPRHGAGGRRHRQRRSGRAFVPSRLLRGLRPRPRWQQHRGRLPRTGAHLGRVGRRHSAGLSGRTAWSESAPAGHALTQRRHPVQRSPALTTACLWRPNSNRRITDSGQTAMQFQQASQRDRSSATKGVAVRSRRWKRSISASRAATGFFVTVRRRRAQR